jgi:hypothetical protein
VSLSHDDALKDVSDSLECTYTDKIHVLCILWIPCHRRFADETKYEHNSSNCSTIDLGPADQQGVRVNPWTAMEQQLLEQALKTYPASTPERWDRIAECLPTRSKKDCMRRYKVHSIVYNTTGQKLAVQNIPSKLAWFILLLTWIL